jgi:uncharacterized protein
VQPARDVASVASRRASLYGRDMSSPPSPLPELQILLLSDGRPGHYHLAEGVAAAIARRRAVRITRRDVRRPGWLPGRLLPGLVGLGWGGRSLAMRLVGLGACLPPADLVISAGGETMAANAAVAAKLGVANIFCGSLRRLPPEAFSLVVSSYARHASLPRHIVTLKPSGIDPFTLRAGAKPRALTGPPATAGLLIGGDSGLFRYTAADWQRLVGFLSETHSELGTRWIVSTSRRSPDAIGDAMAALALEPDSPILEFIDFRSSGPGTLSNLFARVDAIVCTEDSSTMMSEAICAQLPVLGVAPGVHAFKDEEGQYRTFMRTRGWSRSVAIDALTPQLLQSELAAIVPLEDNHLDRLASLLQERLPQLFR